MTTGDDPRIGFSPSLPRSVICRVNDDCCSKGVKHDRCTMNRGDAAGDGGGANDGIVKVRNPRRRRSPPPLDDGPTMRETRDNLWIVAGTKILENRRFIARALLFSSITSLIPTWLWYNVILMRVSSYLQEGFLTWSTRKLILSLCVTLRTAARRFCTL